MKLTSLIAAAALSLVSMSSAIAGPAWNAANNSLSDYYGNKYGVPDWNMTRAEFGNSDFAALLHLGAEGAYELVNGFTVVYSPATDEVLIWESRGTNSEAKEAKTYGGNSSCFGTYGMEVMHAGKPLCLPGSSVGSASTSVYQVHVGTIPAQDRVCTFEGIHGHTC